MPGLSVSPSASPLAAHATESGERRQKQPRRINKGRVPWSDEEKAATQRMYDEVGNANETAERMDMGRTALATWVQLKKMNRS